MESQVSLPAIQRNVWAGRIPLEIILAPSESRTFDQTNPYIVSLCIRKPFISGNRNLTGQRFLFQESHIFRHYFRSFELSLLHR